MVIQPPIKWSPPSSEDVSSTVKQLGQKVLKFCQSLSVYHLYPLFQGLPTGASENKIPSLFFIQPFQYMKMTIYIISLSFFFFRINIHPSAFFTRLGFKIFYNAGHFPLDMLQLVYTFPCSSEFRPKQNKILQYYYLC